MTRELLTLRLGAALAPLLFAAVAAAATNITNPLTGFTGDSTQPATQAALAAAGLNFTNAVDVEPTVTFDSSGALFGSFSVDVDGRNYLRTTATDYANYSFVAEVTWVTNDILSQTAYFGLGAADYGFFRIADWGNQDSAAQLFIEVNPSTLKNDNGITLFQAADPSGLDTGANRLRLTYDWFRKVAEFAIDLNYTSGPFTADVAMPALGTLDLYGADGWPFEPARVYFGGDDGTTYKDFQVTLSTGSMVLGDLNSSGTLTSADWVILRNNQNADLSALTHPQAYALGDLTADKVNDHADFKLFKGLYDAANGPGAFEAMLSTVPEPSSGLLISTATALAVFAARGTRGRG
jgi:hypothetical protein